MPGMLTEMQDWGTHPLNSNGTIFDWLAGVVLILIVAFLWAQVVREID